MEDVIFSAVATLLIAAIAMAPGLLLPRSAAAVPGQWAAMASVSLVLMMVLTALLGFVVSLAGLSLPAVTIVPVSVVAGIAAWLVARRTKGPIGPRLAPDWPALAVALLLVGYGLLNLALGIREESDGTALFHAWYNADWFKHIGHVHALADYGVPARDIFGGGAPLHYYWLIYILPGAGAAVGGDAWAALAAANSVTNALFGLVFYAAMRRCCSSRAIAFVASLLAIVAIAPAGFFLMFARGTTMQEFLATEIAPSGSALLAVSGVIPQHTLAMCAFLAWALLNSGAGKPQPGAAVASRTALAALLTISTLLGAILLVAYGFVRLYRDRLRAVPELAIVAVATVALTLALGVVSIGNPSSAIDSPLLTNPPYPQPSYVLAVLAIGKLIGLTGIPAIFAIVAVGRWRPAGPDETAMRELVVALTAAVILGVTASQMLAPQRLAEETFIRATIPLSVAAALVGAWLVQRLWLGERRQRMMLVTGAAAAVVVGMPAHVARLAWSANFGDIHTTTVPAQDREILAALRRSSGPRDMVWQYPEKPALGVPKGDDSWSAIFAGRTVLNSERATEYGAALPYITLSEQWFAGKDVPIPAEISWVYLSRALHPGSYDALATGLAAPGSGWIMRACLKDACLFSREKGG